MKKILLTIALLSLTGCQSPPLGGDLVIDRVDKTVDKTTLVKLQEDVKYTDANEGEEYIIRVDDNNYAGLSGIDIKFSVENIGATDTAEIKFNLTDANLANIKEYSKLENIVESDVYENGQAIDCTYPATKEVIKGDCFERVLVGTEKTKYIKDVWTEMNGTTTFDADEIKYFKARINFERGSTGNFSIEVIGNNYGILE